MTGRSSVRAAGIILHATVRGVVYSRGMSILFIAIQ